MTLGKLIGDVVLVHSHELQALLASRARDMHYGKRGSMPADWRNSYIYKGRRIYYCLLCRDERGLRKLVASESQVWYKRNRKSTKKVERALQDHLEFHERDMGCALHACEGHDEHGHAIECENCELLAVFEARRRRRAA